MSFGTSKHSESSSSGGEDDESDPTDTESTATCGPVLPVDEPLAFNGIGTINLDRCQDSHIGPRIVTDNLNIILSNPNDFGLVEHITKKNPLYDNRDWEKEIRRNANAKNRVTDENLQNPSFSWNYKRAPFSYIYALRPRKILLICSVFLILVMIVVALVVLFSRNSHDSGGNSTTVTTLTPWPITVPTDDGHTVPPTSTPAVGQFIGRSSWHGMDPPPASARELTTIRFIALDNLQGNHCSSVDTCKTILRQREKAENGSLNYNFLIDDSGNVYEARGWGYKSDYTSSNANAGTTIKVAFIGNYTDSHLTQIQISSFQNYIQMDFTQVLSAAEVEAQCCRGLLNETGPNENVICDIANTIGYVKAKHCSNCRWASGQLNCSK